jgi:GT2 family glycosyltransferase
MDDIELGDPLPTLHPTSEGSETAFTRSICLVRLHGRPLGAIEVGVAAEGLSPQALCDAINADLAPEIEKHLLDDGLAAQPLSTAGLGSDQTPACEAERLQFLERAPNVSVVICTRNRPDSVLETINSLLSGRYPVSRYEVIVVDNAAAGDAPLALDTGALEGDVELRIVRETEPGLSHARNCGLRASAGDYLLFADDDVAIDRDWISTLARAFELSGDVGATSGMTLPGVLETPTQRWTEGFGGRMHGFAPRVYDIENPPPDRPLFPFTIGDFGAGRNMAFRPDVLRDVGGFDPALGPGTVAHDGDDVEALLRVLLSGMKIVNDPAAIVWHAHPEDYEELRDRVFGYGIGLSATLTKAVLVHPRLAATLLRKLPGGVRFALSSDSSKNEGRQGDYPRELVWRELAGIAYGPVAYGRSRLDQRRRRRDRTPVDPVRPSSMDG